MPKYVKGVELTQNGTRDIFEQKEKNSTKYTPTNPTASPVLSSTLLENDPDILHTVHYVHNEYLVKPYPGPLKNPKASEEGRLPPNEGPDRGTHGLAHTVRTMACAEVMVEEARKAQFRGEQLGTAKDGRTLADVTPDELKKILIAQAFFVVGRDDERSGYDEQYDRNFYEEYHKQSEQAFRRYIEDNKLIGKIFKDQKEIDHYAAIVKDRPKNWDGTPAHLLIHQSHMVDLMRVKAPQEVVLENAFNTLQDSVGSLGAEVVLKTHREFLLATGAVVPMFNPEAIDAPKDGGPYENPYNGSKYILEIGQVPHSKKDIQRVNSKYQLEDNERFVTIKEYYTIPEVQQTFPGFKTYLEPSPYESPTPFASSCEQKPTVCLGAIKQVRAKVKMDVIHHAFQSPANRVRRQANGDEIAAVGIIQQIMANPDLIQDDHVLLNGQRLEEQFFRDLLAKCDMAIVGSQLNNTDMNNIDQLMQHEQDTAFHPTDQKEPAKKIGETWEKRIRQKDSFDKDQIKHDLVFLMQNDGWYYSRVNAIAQNRDKGSTFKEVLITTLMTPLTSKALVDTDDGASSPKTLFRGLNFPINFQNKLINQANTIIANTAKPLFTNRSAQGFMQIKLNDLSKISAKTNTSNSTNIEVPRTTFDSNTIFEINDPEQLLQAKQVGTHKRGSEDEFSFYLPDDIALIPTKVTLDGKTSKGMDRYVVTFVAIKSPDFIPRHEHGFAVASFIQLQNAKVTETINAIKEEANGHLNQKLQSLRIEMVRQSNSPIRRGLLDRILHYFSRKDDQKISLERKNFLDNQVIPLLQECHIALRANKMDMLQNTLAKLPSDKEWAVFKSDVAKTAKREMDELKALINKKIALHNQMLPLVQCQEALEEQQVVDALQALSYISSDQDMRHIPSVSDKLREQIQSTKQEVTKNLASLQRAATTPLITDTKHVGERYEALIINMTKRIVDLEAIKPSDVIGMKNALSNLNNLQEELKLLRSEKVMMRTGGEKIDFTDIAKLEEQSRAIYNKLYDAYVIEITKMVAVLEQEKPKKLSDVKKLISSFHNQLVDVELMHQQKIKMHGGSTDLLDLSDIDGLKERLQKVNQYLIKALINNIRVSLNQMEVKTFDAQKKEAQQDLLLLDNLAKTLANSKDTEKQKEHIQKLKQFFVEKQEAYPEMVQLQLKSEALMIQLRKLCEAHQNNAAKLRKTRIQELTRNRWRYQGLTDYLGLTTDERVTLANQEQLLAQFRQDLNNDKFDLQQLIHNLAAKNSSELAEGIGISKETAEKLYSLLTQLNQSTTFVAKIEQRSKLIDELVIELDKLTMTHKLTQIDNEPSPAIAIGI